MVRKFKKSELIEKAREVFAKAEKETINVGEGLTRQELRFLEQRGIVEKLPTFKKSKWAGVTPQKTYVWKWIGEND